MSKKPDLKAVPETDQPAADPTPISKPSPFDLNKFRSKQAAAMANVENLIDQLPIYSISQAQDFARLHPNEEEYWSPELCFVNVPIKGSKRDTLHLIDEELAMRYLPSARIKRFRLALAAKPFDVFFLCQVPTRNADNSWNGSNIRACEQAKVRWVQATSRKEEGAESYKIDSARDADAFPEPKWPKQSLNELLMVIFAGRMIDREDHPGLLRLLGAKQQIS
jgi:hypothetical protein